MQRTSILRRVSEAGIGLARRRSVRVGATALIAGSTIMLTGAGANFSTLKDMGSGSAKPNPFSGASLYVNPASNARRQADQWRTSRPGDAEALDRIARQPSANWIGEWSGNPRKAVADLASKVRKAGAMPVLVAYNIPARDCGLYSAGGAKNASAYRSWIRDFAAGLSGKRAAVILEPDAVAAQCLKGAQEEERMELIRDAVAVLKSKGAVVYIDAGNPTWHSPQVMASRLNRAGIDLADGFALNVSNFYTNAQNIAYGEKVSKRVGGKHFVIDTSRNGNGSNGQWCNPSGRALGSNPTANTGHPLVDAFLWVKQPGESDGSCNGAPKAGQWWTDYALGLANRQPATYANAE